MHNEVKVLKIFFGFLHRIGLVGTHHGSIPSSFWQNTQHRKQDAVFLSKNANTNDEQISKIK